MPCLEDHEVMGDQFHYIKNIGLPAIKFVDEEDPNIFFSRSEMATFKIKLQLFLLLACDCSVIIILANRKEYELTNQNGLMFS